MNTVQKYVDLRNELHAEWHEAFVAVSRNWRMRKNNPQQYKLLKTRELARLERLEEVERLSKQISGEFGLRLCGTATPRMYIYEDRRKHAGMPLQLVAQH